MERNRIIILSIVFVMFISATLSSSFINNKFIVKFDCGEDCETELKYVKKGDAIIPPKNPKKSGKIFIEWQLKGKKYNFNNKVNENIVLKAKWLPEIYVTVSFDVDGKYEKINVLAGNTIKDYKKEPYKEGYKFLGWYQNEEIFDFDKKVTSNIKLIAVFKSENEIKDFKVGDEVIITGNYATSSYSKYAYHSKAIGWKRKIMVIYNNTNYPYAVGDFTGITGYFNSDSIKKAN